MLKVNFVSDSNSGLASFRMRIEKPAALLNASGKALATIENTCLSTADVNVFSKHFQPDKDASAIALSETASVMDICDDHFDRQFGPHYLFMVNHATGVTCNTAAMQERIYDVSGKLARIVPDPVTFPAGEFEYSDDPQYLWYGHVTNIYTILPYVWLFPNLTIITNAEIPNAPPHVKTMPWRPGLVEKLIPRFDIVVLPRNNDPWATTKSPNRAVDAIFAGKFVITDFPEVYGSLSAFCFTGPLKDGMMLYKASPATVELMVKNGQEFIRNHYSDKKITEAWLKTLNLKSSM